MEKFFIVTEESRLITNFTKSIFSEIQTDFALREELNGRKGNH